MKYLELLVFVLISSVYSTNITQDVPTNLQSTTINGRNVTFDSDGSPISVIPQPTSPTVNPNTTTSVPTTPTLNPNITTSKTPITKPTTPIPPTKPPTTPASNVTTTPASNVTTTPASNVTTTTVPTNTTTLSPVTTAKPVNPSTPTPDHPRRFDGPSFVGGIVLALGLVAIGFVAFKFYKARTELNYHTL